MTASDWVQVALAIGGGLGTVGVGLLRYFNGRIEAERLAREEDRHDMRDQVGTVSNGLAAFKEQVARDYPSYQRMGDLLKPISDGIDELKEDMRGLFARIDRKVDK